MFEDVTPRLLRLPGENEGFAREVLAGLRMSPKRIAAKFFYDERGSALFEEITEQSEYYPTRAEMAILTDRRAALAAHIPSGAVIVEFGSGSSRKARLLIEACSRLAGYVPVDISGEMLKREARALMSDYPSLRVEPVIADFTRRFAMPPVAQGAPLVGFFPGSTIGNFDPPDAQRFLVQAGQILGRGSLFIVGVDLEKSPSVLNAAYNDAKGVTARFNLNLLARFNRELGADFNLRHFSHLAFYRPEMSRVEMHLVSLRDQEARIAGERIALAAGEKIHTENSYKYARDRFWALALASGWAPLQFLTDQDGLFGVHLLARS